MFDDASHIEGLAEGLIIENGDLTDLIAHLTIHSRGSLLSRATPAFLLSEFRYAHSKISRRLVGQNYHRPGKIALQPRTLVAFDRQGSRHSETRPDLLNAVPHLHAVMTLVTEHCRLPREDLAAEIQKTILAVDAFERVHIQIIPFRWRDLLRLVSYAIKDAQHLEGSSYWHDIAFELLPLASRGGVARRAWRKAS